MTSVWCAFTNLIPVFKAGCWAFLADSGLSLPAGFALRQSLIALSLPLLAAMISPQSTRHSPPALRAEEETRRPGRPGGRSGQTESALFFSHIMALAGIATWRARSNPLQLLEFRTGMGAPSPFTLDPAKLAPGASWAKSIHPPDRQRVRRFLSASRTVRRGKPIDYRLIVDKGRLLWVRHWLLTASIVRGGRRSLQGFLMAIPEQKHLESECLRISERECQRIGRELHDDLGQVLTGVTCLTQGLHRQAAKVAPALASDIAEMEHELKGATTRVRAMAHGLFPVQLDYFTLRHALQELVRQMAARFPVKFIAQFSGHISSHSPEQILHVYRILQEAVGNSIRHGRAKTIRIFVAASPESMQVRIEDNGSGFPADTAHLDGIGMHIMQYRTRMLGGEIRFRNLSRRGALISLKYPLRPIPSPIPSNFPTNENQSLHG